MPSGIFVATKGYLLFNSVDLSDHVESFQLDLDKDEVDVTNFGSTGEQTLLTGIGKGKLTVVFHQDYAAAKVDATLWAAFAAGVSVPVEVRADQAARSATNPGYTGNVLVSKYTPVGVKVGDAAKVSISWPKTGAAFVRNTA